MVDTHRIKVLMADKNLSKPFTQKLKPARLIAMK